MLIADIKRDVAAHFMTMSIGRFEEWMRVQTNGAAGGDRPIYEMILSNYLSLAEPLDFNAWSSAQCCLEWASNHLDIRSCSLAVKALLSKSEIVGSNPTRGVMIQTVNILVTENGLPASFRSFQDDEIGNVRAEKHFRDLIAKVDPSANEKSIDACVDERDWEGEWNGKPCAIFLMCSEEDDFCSEEK